MKKKIQQLQLQQNENESSENVDLYNEFLEVQQEFFNKWMKENTYKPDNPEIVEKYNSKFRREYTAFLNENKEKYKLTEENIAYWLKF